MKKLSLNMKIAGVLGIFVATAIVICIFSLSKMGAMSTSLHEIMNTQNRLDHVIRVRDTQRQLALAESGILMYERKEDLEAETKKIDGLEAKVKEIIQDWEKVASDAGKVLIKEYNPLRAEWLGYVHEEYRLMLQGKHTEALAIAAAKGIPVRTKMLDMLQANIDLNEKWSVESKDKAETAFREAQVSLVVISTTSILAGLLLAFFIMRALSRTISRVIQDLDNNSGQVTSASQQIAAASTQLSQATTEQAASLEETSSAIEELNSMLQKNAENADRSSNLSATSQKDAERGQRVVQDMIAAIEDINTSNTGIVNQINDSNQKISEIVKLISEIGNKTKVINDIVFQTKLLSFNASVEAARAGEHGKGFAVVAEEVGNLAQMSGNAAKEISDMLDGSISKVEGIVHDTKSKVEALVSTCKGKVESGTSVAKECGQVLGEIVGNVTKVAEMVGDISQACKEQAQGIREITSAINQLDQVTQQNAATSEEAASSAEELSAQAEALKGVVGVLIATIHGGRAEHVAFPAATPMHRVAPVSKPAAPAHSHANTKKILHLKNATETAKAPVADGRPPMKKAAGLEGVPASNDPGFEDV